MQAWEKEKQDLQDQISDLGERLVFSISVGLFVFILSLLKEMIALDKEIAEEKVESLESELLTATEELATVTQQLQDIEEDKKKRLEALNQEGGSTGGNTEEYPFLSIPFYFCFIDCE